LGVVNIDVLKRTHVTSAIDVAIVELEKLEHELMLACLAPADKSEFGWGHHCGSVQIARRCRTILEHCLNESDPVRGRHEES
jgi:hypothetical protein